MTSPSPTVPVRAQILLPVLVALLVIVGVSPIADILVSRSIRFGEYQDRFQFIGLLYANLPQITMVLVLVIVSGLVGGSRAVVRGGAMAATVIGIVLLVLLPVFGLDFLQARHVVAQNAQSLFVATALKTIVFAVVLLLLLVWGGVRGLRATPKPAVTGRHQRTKGEGLIVAQDQDGER